MFGLGVPELALILVIVIVLFGAAKLPRIGRGLGEGITGFRDALKPKDDKAAVEPPSGKSDRPA